jgi:uncharacterized protein YbjQ (UPF0145 family)
MARDASLRREPVLRGAEAPHPRGADIGVWGATEPALREVLVTTTPSVEGRPVEAYLGVVMGEVVVSADILHDAQPRGGFLARLRGRASTESEATLSASREKAIRELKGRAASRGADAVVGVVVGLQVVGELLVVTASGTAVRVAEARKP